MDKRVKDFLKDPDVQELIENNKFSRLLDIIPGPIREDVITILIQSGIDFTADLKSIPTFTFTYIKLPELDLSKTNIEKLDYKSFYASAIPKIILPKTLNYIGIAAFSGASLQSIEIPEGVEFLRGDTFQGCHDLEKIEIPVSMVRIGEAFNGCYALKYIKYKGTIKEWKDIEKVGDTKFVNEIGVKVHCRDGITKYDG